MKATFDIYRYGDEHKMKLFKWLNLNKINLGIVSELILR